MGSFVSRRSILATASGIGVWLTAANGPSLADDDRSAPLAGGKSFLIAIPKFAVSNARNADIADRIRQVIIDRFSHLEPYALSRDATERTTNIDVDRLPEFSTWQSRNVQFLIIAQVDSGDDGKLKVAARMWNVPDRKHFYGGQVIDRIENWQRAADFLADEIGRRLPDQGSASHRERPKGD
jgi:Tol biopolymer transport system component